MSIAAVSLAASAVQDPFDAVRQAIARGEKHISVPADRYFVDPKDGNGKVYLELKGLSDTVIDFGGADLVGKVRTRFLQMEDCTNVTLKGFSLDFDPLPYTQGIIRSVDQDGTWDVEIVDGYPDVEATDGGNEPIDAHDPFWPVQVYDGKTYELKNPMRFRDGIAVVHTAPGRFRISGGLNRRGEVGDVAVWSVREPRKVENECFMTLRTKNCRFEDLTFYATPHGRIIEVFCSSNSYVRCRMVRRPPEKDIHPRGMPRLRSGNHDFIIAKCGAIGPQIIGCTAEYHCDDCVNISGMYCLVTEAKDRELRVLKDWFCGAGVGEGDDVQIMFPDGTCPPDAKVVSVRPAGPKTADETAFANTLGLWPGTPERMGDALEVILDREVEGLKPGAIIMSENKSCNGFLVKDCRFGSTRARGMLIKASKGRVENCVVDRPVFVTTEYEWLSGGCSSDIEFIGNRFMSYVEIGGAVCRTANGIGLPPSAHRNIVFRDNYIKDGVAAMGCLGLDLRNNRIEGPVTTRNCENVLLDSSPKEGDATQVNIVPAINQVAKSFYTFGAKPAEGGKRVLFVGNSITMHEPRPSIGWTNCCGMAASDLAHDYVHRFAERMSREEQNASFAVFQVAGSVERGFTNDIWLTEEVFAPVRDYRADVIFLFFGANVLPEYDRNPAMFPRRFGDSIVDLVRFVDPARKANVFISEGYYVRQVLDEEKAAAAKELDATMVRISDIRADGKTRGRFNHPNDYGMKCIADRFYDTYTNQQKGRKP